MSGAIKSNSGSDPQCAIKCGQCAGEEETPMTTKPLRRIADDDLRGQPGLSRAAIDSLVEQQPATVMQALRIHGVGRKTSARLLALGILSDPEGVQNRAMTLEELRRK
jgi:nucleotidyltransferase/DNA polymerase involved in DNA repair